MARYNTVAPVASVTTTGTLSTPNQGLFTTLTGSAPYTVTLANPVLYAGATQTFYNSTSGVVTLSTPSGAFNGPGAGGTATIQMPSNTVLQIISDGTNYVTVQDDNSTFTATTGTFSSTLTAQSTLVAQAAVQFTGTGYVLMPSGSIAQRPGSPTAGYTRYNSDLGLLETYNAQGTWQPAGGFKHVDVSGGYSASSWDFCWTNTSSTALTITLPASPSKGDTIRIVDIAKTFDSNNLTIARNGQLIQGDAANMTVNIEGAAFDLIFYNATYGWRIFTV